MSPQLPIYNLRRRHRLAPPKWKEWRSGSSVFYPRNHDLVIETVELLLKSKYDERENRLGHTQILHLMKLCLRTYFTFGGTIYEQVKGTPMGSPISGFIAEAVLQRLESLVFQHHRPKFWARYVDDTFVVIERDQVLTFQEHLNAVFPDIQFTMEEEENNQLAFLDVLCVQHADMAASRVPIFGAEFLVAFDLLGDCRQYLPHNQTITPAVLGMPSSEAFRQTPVLDPDLSSPNTPISCVPISTPLIHHTM
nr:unnamed protein product [Spirometra erinaceieuropaei]